MNLQNYLERIFELSRLDTTWRREVLAGTVSFFTIVYIIAVNAAILRDAGIPYGAAVLATVLVSFLSCCLMGLWANLPIILVPGMGINALFAYTLVAGMGIAWPVALGAVTAAGALFLVLVASGVAAKIAAAIPSSLNEAITVGIGIFLAFIGLQKGGLVTVSDKTVVMLGSLHDPNVLLTLATLVVLVALFIRRVPGGMLLSIVFGTGLAWATGHLHAATPQTMASAFDWTALGALSVKDWRSAAFCLATFSLTLVVLFENIGLIQGQLQLLERPNAFSRAVQANALSVVLAGLLGTSPTVATVETAAGIAAGGRSGLTALTTGCLFLAALACIPLIEVIPASAVAPILILIGALMLQGVQRIDLEDFSEAFPAFLTIIFIPLTYSIVDGIAFGFIAYPLLKLLAGRRREVPRSFYVISSLFVLNFVFKYVSQS